jgi:hypothetical protein
MSDGPHHIDAEREAFDLLRVRLQSERADAVKALRSICRAYGDNDWADTVPLGDVIRNHLHVPLDEAQGG